MLFRYKKSFEKIAMGLMSFMPKERELKKLQQTMHIYEENPDWQLFLWKKEDDFVGLLGVEVSEKSYTIHHLSVNPSHRGDGIGHEMVEKIQNLMQDRKMLATEETEPFLKKCPIKKGDL
ncbi:riboflavin biosynthesis protein ribT, acetyltransferase GNAT-family [Planococcus antarcticus DSM 14505]|uniref:GNAT family N-acetyltransferase n=1 Tax=Planococcus antarcticus DSM 14505 TaxID=1185653 RepID=A0A1C7DH87_9BACL|nr:GNAT family N-acetyltransferase [Planococcus antarcticus]ANU10631.1 GNAT family N-acetyltransferase [Planococcus antarcticus DSM 14505]EIM06717.1 riboflavin biosynthesis protein ribT, acetyltransferase GNAT-family [Planococcus antarcticus DSM 14505]